MSTALFDEMGAGVKGGYLGLLLLLERLGNFFGALPSCFPSAKSFRSCRVASAGSGWLLVLARDLKVGHMLVLREASDQAYSCDFFRRQSTCRAGYLD